MSANDLISRLNAALEGRYRVVREIGEGGMAVVYLAEDLRHERRVALKVLKPQLVAVVGAERFLAEIKTTANLQHPHILPLFDSGQAESFLYYVMPYVEGESLRDRIDREKQLPVQEAIRITTDIAEALDHAHRHGVVHRDIKPANILLTDGRPVIADFGIALALAHAGGGRVTETGLSIGTPHYMSPEQATGERNVDPRTDVYALGCVLYEMLVGDPPYGGSTAQAVLAKILTGPAPAPTETRLSIPPNVDAAIRKALEKLPADRFPTAKDFAGALSEPGFRYAEHAATNVAVAATQWTPIAKAATAVALIVVLGFGLSLLRPETTAPVSRFPSPFLDGQAPIGTVELTPDGSALVYTGPSRSGGTQNQLWIRRWESLSATPIPETEGARADRLAQISLSPSGLEVVFAVGGAGSGSGLRIASLDGGPSRALIGPATAAGGWAEDGWVYYQGENVILRVPAVGGEAERLTERTGGELSHGPLQLLPGGRAAVFQVWHAADGSDSQVWWLDVETGDRRMLTLGNTPHYTPTGHLLFGTPDGTLMAAPFSVERAELTGPAVPVAEGLNSDTGLLSYSVSQTGALVYRAGESLGEGYEFVWVTRSGEATPVDPGESFNPGLGNIGWRLSPNGDRIAFQRELDGNEDIWTKELPDGPFSRLTFDGAGDREPQWTPDGRSVTFRSDRAGASHLWSRYADGTGDAEVVFDGFSVAKGVWSPDGEWLILRRAGLSTTSSEAARDILALRPGVDSVPIPLIVTDEFSEQGPAISRDGRWLAYSSNETGRDEVFVRPFPEVDGGKWQVSTEGGISPVWANNGRELFFVNPETRELVTAEFATSPTFRRLRLETLFTIPSSYSLNPTGNSDFYDISPDDERFLMARRQGREEEASLFVLVLNFFEELRRVGP